MRKIILWATVSLDGYFEGPGGDISWHRMTEQLHTYINEQIAQQIAPSRASRYQTQERRRASSAAHRRIFEAIAQGDGELAEQEARAHVLDISDQIDRAATDRKTVQS